MIRRTALAAGAVGAVVLALSGAGSVASFTSSISGSNSITSGTFQLEAVPGSATVTGPLIHDANNIGQPTQTLTATAEPNVVGQGNALAYTLANANPGDTYDYTFSVQDVGTLQGQVDTINYSPGSGGSTSPLLNNMTVEVQEQINNVWTDIHNNSNDGSSGTALSAAQSHTYYLDYEFGPQFLQPKGGTNTDETSATFRVQFVFLDPTTNPNSEGGYVVSQNNAEGISANPTITVNGTNTP